MGRSVLTVGFWALCLGWMGVGTLCGEQDDRREIRALLDAGRRQERLPADVVVRVAANLSGADPDKLAAAQARGEKFDESIEEIWEFTAERVYRVEMRRDGEPMRRYQRTDSKSWDSRRLCGELLEGKLLEIGAQEQEGPAELFAGTPYTRGERSIQVLRNGQVLLEVGEHCAEAGYSEKDAQAFGALYERVVRPARAKFRATTTRGERPPRPNILFAIADDWGVHAGAYGTPWVKTPAIDRLAREGLRFQNAFTPMAKCAPSRAILLTGRHLWQNEEAGNHLSFFPPKLKSWPEVLHERGWHMGYTGKGWGPGVANDAQAKPRAITGRRFDQRKTTPPAAAMGNLDYAANFVDFLDAAPQDSPWCFWYGSTEPHRDYEFQAGVRRGGKRLADIDRVPEYWPDNETVRHDMLDYAFEVEYMDSHLGRMLAELERRGLLDSTLVIATSDHGMPFPRVKGYAYYESNHVPLVVRWPAGIGAGGRVIEDFVDFTDVAPTVLDYARIEARDSGMRPLTGQSWRPILESTAGGRVVPTRDHALVGKERTDVGRPRNQGYPIRGIVTEEFLYLRNYEPSRWPAGNPETGYLDTDGSPTKSLILELGRANRSDRFWRLNFGPRPGDELYDLRGDRDCVRNLAQEPAHAEQVVSLRRRLESLLAAHADPRMAGRGQIFDEYTPTAGDGFYEKFQRGEKVNAGWVNPSDFEKEPVPFVPER